MKIVQRLGAVGITLGLLTTVNVPAGAETLLKTKFFKETSSPLPSDLQPAPPSFEGKAFVKDADGRYVPVKRSPALFPISPFAPSAAGATAVDLYIQDGSETSVAINYGNGNNVLATYNEGWDFNPDIPHSNSTNGNLSWTNRSFPVGGGTYTGSPYDPWANAGNAAGEFFSTQIRRDVATANTHCVVARSTDGGGSFSLFFERVKAVFQDREMVDVDKTMARGGGSGTTHDGKVYLCYDDWSAGNTAFAGSFLQIISSAGTALTELQIADLAGPFEGSQMQPVAGTTDGTIYIQAAAISGGGATSFGIFHEITNAGAGPNTIIKSSLSWPATGQQLGATSRWGLNGARIDNHGYLDIDRSAAGPRRGYLFFISNRNPNPANATLDQGDVYLSVSTNGASSWSSAFLIPTAAGKTQYFPMLDVDDNGLLHVAYYQNETGLTNGGVLNAGTANLYYTLSTNGGSVWSSPVQINTAANALDMEDPPPNRAGANYYMNGDYAQLQATGTGASTKVYILWSGYDKDRNNAFVGDKKERVYCTTYLPNPPVCANIKGDMDGDGFHTGPDVILLLNCAYLGTGSCDLCFADVNCDGFVTGPDVILLLNRAYLGSTAPPWCGP